MAVIGPFHVMFAIGADDRREEYRLRYEVFVEEYQFEPAGSGERLERDEFDASSCSFLLRDRATGEPAACQRLVLPDRLPAGMLTNVEREYRPLEGRPAIDFGGLRPDTWAEASRTTVAPKYRWGSAAATWPAMLAVKYASIALALAFERTSLFSLSEPCTSRLIRKLGFAMVQVGAAVDFHGRRAPFQMDVDAMLRSVPDRDRLALDQLIRAAAIAAADRDCLARSR